MQITHHKGLLGELAFTFRLIQKGYTILSPINPNSSYDLVAEKNGIFTRIQVKYCTPLNGRLRIELDRPKRITLNYRKRGVDAMGAYDGKNNKFYLIPMKEIKSKDEIWLRVEKPRNSQVKNINSAEKFEI